MTTIDDSVDIRAKAAGFVRAKASDFHGRRVIVVDAQNGDDAGALTPSDGHTIAAAARYALDQRLPLVIRLASSGADLREGVAALDGWGGAAREMTRCSGVIPSVVIVCGPTVSGPALMLGLADVVIMVDESYAFVSGPVMVEQFTGVPIGSAELGGAAVHGRTSGVATLVAADLEEAEALAAEVLAFLPDHTDDPAPAVACNDPVDRPTPEAYAVLPESANGSYDCRDVLAAIVDDGHLLELHTDWAANLVTAFARIGGRPIGIVANQPQTIAGTLNITASRKGARFVALCDAFNLSILTVVDTSGFYPGKDLEWRGMIRYGAQMAFAYARATVPRVNVTTRKSYGGAYIVMDSKRMGNDMALAWPSAEIAVMGAKGAVEILHRGATAEEREELQAGYEERLLNPYIAAERGTIDAVIDPADTRAEIHAALEMLAGKRERLPRRRHDNTPL
ncbi:MAG: carboxyl transferase domain-containing protein [Acidimicrobiales bacterium]|nr:carboxyl transferase domain-containing protein [Acidimicrobiales bacterium]